MILNDNQRFFVHVLWVVTKEKIKCHINSLLQTKEIQCGLLLFFAQIPNNLYDIQFNIVWVNGTTRILLR